MVAQDCRWTAGSGADLWRRLQQQRRTGGAGLASGRGHELADNHRGRSPQAAQGAQAALLHDPAAGPDDAGRRSEWRRHPGRDAPAGHSGRRAEAGDHDHRRAGARPGELGALPARGPQVRSSRDALAELRQLLAASCCSSGWSTSTSCSASSSCSPRSTTATTRRSPARFATSPGTPSHGSRVSGELTPHAARWARRSPEPTARPCYWMKPRDTSATARWTTPSGATGRRPRPRAPRANTAPRRRRSGAWRWCTTTVTKAASAGELVERSLAIARRLDDEVLAGEALNVLAGFAFESGAIDEARARYLEALGAQRERSRRARPDRAESRHPGQHPGQPRGRADALPALARGVRAVGRREGPRDRLPQPGHGERRPRAVGGRRRLLPPQPRAGHRGRRRPPHRTLPPQSLRGPRRPAAVRGGPGQRRVGAPDLRQAGRTTRQGRRLQGAGRGLPGDRPPRPGRVAAADRDRPGGQHRARC